MRILLTICSSVPGYHLAGPHRDGSKGIQGSCPKEIDLCVQTCKDIELEKEQVVGKCVACGFLFLSVVRHHFLMSAHEEEVGHQSATVEYGMVGEKLFWRACSGPRKG